MKPLISVIVPIYNLYLYLPRFMESFLTQTVNNYEIILVDDGSSDGSEILCDQYENSNPNSIFCIHKENGGLSSARNAGIDAARGEYVIFPDPDDWVEPEYLESLLNLQMNYNVDLVCIGHFVDYDDRRIEANIGQTLQIMTGYEAQKSLIIPPCINGFAWNKLYHLDIIRKYNLRFLDDVGTTEDLDFAFRYLNYCKKIVFSPEDRLYHYFQRRGAATHSGFLLKKLESIRTYQKIIENSRDDELIRAAKEEICNINVNLVWDYQNSRLRDMKAEEQIHQFLGRYLKYYCTSERYSLSRKVQAIMAYKTPKLYAQIKNQISKGK